MIVIGGGTDVDLTGRTEMIFVLVPGTGFTVADLMDDCIADLMDDCIGDLDEIVLEFGLLLSRFGVFDDILLSNDGWPDSVIFVVV